jgi:hypothetical protein
VVIALLAVAAGGVCRLAAGIVTAILTACTVATALNKIVAYHLIAVRTLGVPRDLLARDTPTKRDPARDIPPRLYGYVGHRGDKWAMCEYGSGCLFANPPAGGPTTDNS